MSQTPILHALSLARGAADPAPDAELLRRFAEADDQTAFELVVRRHAELVWGVCRSALPRDAHAAEDAFQATFLALARKAGSLRDRSAAGWLFRVARNAAVRARVRLATQQAAPLPDDLAGGERPAGDEAARREVSPVVAEEVERLAASLREPVVLCFFEGHTHAEAATRLGWPVGTVASRLARAKDVLRDRLTRRGVVLPAAGLAGVFATAHASAAPVRLALSVAGATANPVPSEVLSLAQGVLSAMRYTKIKLAAALLVVAVGLSVAVAALPRREPPPQATPERRADGPKKPDPETLLKPLWGKWRVVSDQLSDDSRPIPRDPFRVSDLERLSRLVTVIEGDRMTTDNGSGDGPVKWAIKIPPDARPGQADFVITDGPKEEVGKTVRTIYKLDGDRLTLCLRHPEHADKGRPTEFKDGPTQVVEVLERVGDEKAELKKLAGEWAGKKLLLNDGETATTVVADEEVKAKWVFDGAEVSFSGDGDGGERATVKLDPQADPPRIDLTVTRGERKGTKLVGIYWRRNDKLALCFAHPVVADARRPTMLFPNTGVLYYLLDRAPKK